MSAGAGKRTANDGVEEPFLDSKKRTQLQEKPSKLRNFCRFLCNREEGTCLGRTAKSWVEITIFYIIFYACLAGFWIACLAVFVQTLDDKVPRYYGKGTIIGINPGMGYQPWMKDNPETTLIRFNKRDPKSYEQFVTALEVFLKRYENTTDTRVCTGKESNNDDVEKACRFDLKQFNAAGCGKKDQYGYKTATPCVVLTLNRLIGWRPLAYPKDSAPDVIHKRYKEGYVTINCDGEYTPDTEHVGEMKFIPEAGMPGKYFPYKVMKNYHQPIAMVKFSNLPLNQLVQVECKAYAYNIIHDSADRLGLVHFEILIEDFEPDADDARKR